MDRGAYLRFQKNSAELYHHILETAAADCGLTLPEAEVLLFFHNNPSCDAAVDAVRLRGFSKAYVSKAVELLQKRGLIAVRGDQKDRRYQHISFLPAAEQTRGQLRAAQESYFELLRAGILPEEEALLWSMVERMAQNVERAAKER